MSTPPALGTYRVTWIAGEGAPPRIQKVEAVGVEIDTVANFTLLRGSDDAAAFIVNNAFLVSVERITEKD